MSVGCFEKSLAVARITFCFELSSKELAAEAWIVIAVMAVATEIKLTVGGCIVVRRLVAATGVRAAVTCALEGSWLAGVGTG